MSFVALLPVEAEQVLWPAHAVPALTAAALYPVPDEPERPVDAFLRLEVKEGREVHLPLTDGDWQALRAVWSATGLPEPSTPMTSNEWVPYLVAFNEDPGNPDWQFAVMPPRDPYLQQRIARISTEDEHRKVLRQAIDSGDVEARLRGSNIVSKGIGSLEQLELTKEALTQFCTSLLIDVVTVDTMNGDGAAWPREIGGQRVWKLSEAFRALERQQAWPAGQGGVYADTAVKSGITVRDPQGLGRPAGRLSVIADHLFTSDVNDWLVSRKAPFALRDEEDGHGATPTLSQGDDFTLAVAGVADAIPGVEWLTWAEATEWLERMTGESWALPRIVRSGVGIGVWIEPHPNPLPSHMEHVFQGRWQGFMALVVDGHDRERLAAERTTGVISTTHRPDKTSIRVTPPVKFDAADAKVLAQDLKCLLVCVRRGIYPESAEPVTLHFGKERVTPMDPGFAAWAALHGGAERLVGQKAQPIRFVELPKEVPTYLYSLGIEEGRNSYSVSDSVLATAQAIHPSLGWQDVPSSIVIIMTSHTHKAKLLRDIEKGEIIARSPLTGDIPEHPVNTYPDTVSDRWLLPLSEFRKFCDGLLIELVPKRASASLAVMSNVITSDGAPRATWQLGLEALLPALERQIGRPAKVREVIKHLKAQGAAYRIEPDGGPDQLFWRTQMNDRKPIAAKTISNAVSDWRKSRKPV